LLKLLSGLLTFQPQDYVNDFVPSTVNPT